MTDCQFPFNTGQTGYWKGCRCDRCRAAKSAAGAARPTSTKPCPSCDRRMASQAKTCAECFKRPAITRVMEKIRIDGGCWVFTGEINRSGYGRIKVGPGKSRVAHRVTYEHYVGAVPNGLELDHLCVNPACCNPDHLEAVTHSVNMQRVHARESIA